MKQNWTVKELKDYLHTMEERAVRYYEIKKGIRERPMPKRRLDWDKVKENKEEAKEEERRKRDALKPDLIRQNELYHFGPAKVAVGLAREALNAYRENRVEEAVIKLEQAVEHFPDNLDLSFNLGKMFLETGVDVAGGIVHLLDYYLADADDYYNKEISKVLHLALNKNQFTGYIDNGAHQIHFEIDGEYVQFDEIPEDYTFTFHLPYKIPVSLGLERIDKEQIEMKDYQFLKEVFKMETQLPDAVYEIVINKGSFRPFVKEFYGTVLELSVKDGVQELTSFKDLHIEQLEQEHYHEGPFNEPKEIAFGGQNSQLVSIVRVEINEENRDEFLELFKGFAKKHLINEKSDEELDQEEDEWERMEQAQYENDGRFEMEAMLHEDYQSFLGNAKLYGDVAVILHNIEHNIPDPYETKNEQVFKEQQEKYMALLGDVFDEITASQTSKKQLISGDEQKKEDPAQTNLNDIFEQIKSDKVKKILTAHVKDILDLLEDKTHLAMGPIRLTLEVLLKESSLKVGISLVEKKRKKTLNDLINETRIKKRYPKTIDDQMYNIRTMSNSSLHYNALEEYITIDETEVKELFAQLLNIIEYFVKRFRL